MAFNSASERPALNFGPRSHARWSSRRFLLWPAWGYRVVAPRARQRKLNVLQRAIMGLCRAGVHRVDAVADHLSIHTDLAAFILLELKNHEYLDQHGLPTEDGVNALEKDTLEPQEMVAGYVFQDPWNGDLWPRFVESLDYCELDFKGRQFPSLLFGTTGKPRRQSAFTVRVDNVAPATPTPAEVVQAVAQHRKGLRFMDADDTDDEALGTFVASGVQISMVSFVEEKPQLFSLMTYLYVPKSSDGAMDWCACDPFGLGQSVRLRRRVKAKMYKDPDLFGVVKSLFGQTLHASYEDQQRWLEAVQHQAGLEIDRRLTIDFRNHAGFEQVLEMEAARQEMQMPGRDSLGRKINETLRAGSKVLEVMFSSLTVEHPLGAVWKRVYVSRVDRQTGKQCFVPQQDSGVYSATYEGAFRSLGFAAPIPDALLNVKPGQIKSVSKYNDSWRLRPLVVATALVAQRDPSHPLARAAVRSTGLLVAIDEIATAGGRAGHAHSHSLSVEDAEQHVDKVYDVVSTLLGLDRSGSEAATENTGDSHG